ncbi:hypothetical protein [Mesorhizobium sp. B2-3-5]|nr:hypothetical protein [Mesorhizobium sp. B2-3-5]
MSTRSRMHEAKSPAARRAVTFTSVREAIPSNSSLFSKGVPVSRIA